MKTEIKEKKGLRTVLSIIVDKKTIEKKLNERLNELQNEVNLKGFRPGKVPANVIKSQFGKAIYGEVIDKILKESSTKAIEEKKIKAVGQPKIDLKTFGEGKDLNYELQIDSMPQIELSSFEKFKATEYKVKLENKVIEDKLVEISKQHKIFAEKQENEKAILGDQVIFDYSATVDNKKFEGSEGKGVQIELGQDLFLKGFDEQIIGTKKNEKKSVEVNLPSNHPKKELANKKTKFDCLILNVKKPQENKIDDNFAKIMGAKDLPDLKRLIESQIISQYKQALDSFTKKEILDQIGKFYKLDLPQNLIENELSAITQSLKKDEIEKHKTKNTELAKSRIKLGLVLNAYGEKNNVKVEDHEIHSEIQKQIKGMPGQEKMIMEYYKKNPNAAQSLKGALYEEKIISSIKSKIKLIVKEVSSKEAEAIISDLNTQKKSDIDVKKTKPSSKSRAKSKKISKK